MLRAIYFAETRTRADRLRDDFAQWCRGNGHDHAETLEWDWERMTTYYDFPKEHWGHLRNTNPVESSFRGPVAENRRGQALRAGGRSMAAIWKMLMPMERRLRRVKSPDLMPEVHLGTRYVDGITVQEAVEKVAA